MEYWTWKIRFSFVVAILITTLKMVFTFQRLFYHKIASFSSSSSKCNLYLVKLHGLCIVSHNPWNGSRENPLASQFSVCTPWIYIGSQTTSFYDFLWILLMFSQLLKVNIISVAKDINTFQMGYRDNGFEIEFFFFRIGFLLFIVTRTTIGHFWFDRYMFIFRFQLVDFKLHHSK